MGQLMKNKITYGLDDDLATFFSLPELEEDNKPSYENLKEQIYELEIDQEEKANIINKINSLSIAKSNKEQDKIIKEIEEFKQNYQL